MVRGSKKVVLCGVELQGKIDALHHYYLPMDLDINHHKSKIDAVKKIEFIIKNTTHRNLQEAEFTDMVVCSLTLIYYFGMQLKLSRLRSRKLNTWRQECLFEKAENAFQKTMDYLQPERTDVTMQLTLNFFSHVFLWPYENFVVQILEVVLYYSTSRMVLFNFMLTDIHYVLFTDLKSARHRMRVLYELLRSKNWVIEKHKLLPFITRLLDFFAYSIAKSNNISMYKYLQKGFEMCLRRIFEQADNRHRLTILTTMLNWFAMVNMNDDDVLQFASLLDHAADLYKVTSYSDSFSEGLFSHVLRNLVASSDGLYNLVGLRLLVRFLDRQSNAPYLCMPTLYYEFSQVQLKIGNYDSGDKNFIRQHREKIHDYFLRACKKHCHNTDNLTSLFSVICIIVLEVPCGLTAAVAACIMMSIQDFALNGENLSATCRYWMHALVISVMSLICWVHKAPVLYSYVSAIISRRAKEAPQLNPPLMPLYNVAHHHVTWNKPTLFFEDWELRYGLWKHFQDPQPVKRSRTRELTRKKNYRRINI